VDLDAGADIINQPGIYETQRAPAPDNTPGGREGALSWIDNAGTPWIFGGSGYDGTGVFGNLSDLWKCGEYYNPPTDTGHQGALRVTLGPPEALAAGAQWRIADQPWGNSGGGALSLVSGLHRIQFKEISGWRPIREVRQIIAGGRETNLHFEYEPLEMYEVGEVPPLTVRHGDTATFRVNCVSMTVEGKTPPTPAPVFDPVTKIFSYTPGDNDREVFLVTFHAAQGRGDLYQTVQVQPLANLLPEQNILQFKKPVPDAASSDYLLVSDITNPDLEFFNHSDTPINTHAITITGKTIVIEEGGSNALFEQYGGRRDIKSLILFAEELVIRSPFHLPQTDVTIYSRRLKFEDQDPLNRAGIITRPLTDPLIPAAGVDGKNGLKAGNIRVHMERLSDTYGGRRFILKGGDGQKGGSGGQAGAGGNGGDFFSNFDLSLFAYAPGGHYGIMGAIPSEKAYGDPGTITINEDPLAWLRPEFFHSILIHVNDAYLNGNLDFVQDIMTEYLGILIAYEGDFPDGTEDEFAQFRSEVENLAHRAGNNLDYFGNPAGWVPMLSFEVNMALYENEIERAIKVLYLTYWLKSSDKSRTEQVDALIFARNRMREEIADFSERYNHAQALIPGLEVQQQNIINEISVVEQELVDLEKAFLKRAERIVADRHKVPAWKKALRIVSVVCKMVPVYQPALAAIGTGLDLVTKIDINKPMESFQAIAGAVQSFSGAAYKQKAANLMTKINLMGPPSNLDHTNAGDWFKQLGETAKELSSDLIPIKDILKKTEVPKSEVEAELLKIKASDPAFEQAINRIRELNIKKEIFTQQLAEAMQLVTMMANGITQNLLGVDATSVAIAENLAQRNHEAMQYVREMERRAWDRLLRYRYYMMKAYEYRFLQPCPGEYSLEKLFTKFAEMIQSGDNPLTRDDYTDLKAAFYDDVDEVILSIVDELNKLPPERTRSYGVSLTPAELTRLNEEGKVIINMMTRGDGGLSHTEQNIRIVELKTIYGVVVPKIPGGTPQEVDIEYEHSGLSCLEWKGNIYHFTHGNTNPDNYIPLTWKSTYKGLIPEPYWEHHELSEAGQSLVRFLMERAGYATNDHIMRYSRPAAWADIIIKKSRGAGMRVDQLVFDVKVDYFAKTDTGKSTLAVCVNDELMPRILIDKQDVNERRDGDGTFHRTFHRNETVRLTAPLTFGTWEFDGWAQSSGGTVRMIGGMEFQDYSQPRLTLLSANPSIDIYLNDNQTIYARYTQTVTGLTEPLVSGADSPTTDSRPTWVWWSGGGRGAGVYRYGWAEGTWIAEGVTATSFTPSSDLPDGSHTLYVQERDDSSEWSPSGSFMVLIAKSSDYHTVMFQTDGTPGATISGERIQYVLQGGSCLPVRADAPEGHHFFRWTKGGLSYSTDNPLTVVNVMEDMTLTAEFALSKAELVRDFILGRSSDSTGMDVNDDGRVDVADLIAAMPADN